MPITPGGNPTGGSPGGASTPPGGSASSFTALTDAEEKALRETFSLDKATKNYDKSAENLRKTIESLIETKKKELGSLRAGSAAYQELDKEIELLEESYTKLDKKSKDYTTTLGKLRKTLDEMVEKKKKELEATDKASKKYKDLEKDLARLKDAYSKVTDEMDDGLTTLERVINKTEKFSRALHGSIGAIGESLKSYHAYNLEIQKQIELSGKWGGAYTTAHRAFEDVRSQLTLTREEGLKFIGTWSEAQKLGLASDEVVKLTKNLRDLYGTAEGLKMMGEFIKIPASARTLKDLAGGKNIESTLIALKRATPEQRQDIIGTQRAAAGRPERAQRAARFQGMEAFGEKIRDNIKLGFQAVADTSLGPEFGALLVPMTGMADDVHSILQIIQNSSNALGMIGGGFGAAKAAAGFGGAGGAAGGVGGALKGLVGGGGGVGGLLKAGGLGLAGAALSWAGGGTKEYGKSLQEQGYTETGQAVEAGGSFMNIGGRALTGAAIGTMVPIPGATAVGAGIGALVGVWEEWGGNIVDAITGVGDKIEKQRQAGETPEKYEALERFAADMDVLDKQIKQIAEEIALQPQRMAAEVEMSRLPTALASINPQRMFDITERAATDFADTMDYASQSYDEQIKKVRASMQKLQEGFDNGNISQKDYDAMMRQYTQTLNKLTNETLRATLENAPTRRAAAGAMQRLETRGGQIGMEQATTRTTFQRTAAITGNIEEISKFQADMTKGYDDVLKETERAAKLQEINLNTEKRWYESQLENTNLDEAQAEVYREQLDAVNNQLEQNQRVLNSKREMTKLEKQNLEIETFREKLASAEKSVAFRRAQQAITLAKAQQELVVERGGAPEEVGELARKQAAEAESQGEMFFKNFDENIRKATDEMNQAFREGKTEVGIQKEQEIANYRNKGVEIEKNILALKIQGASAEKQLRMDQLGVQKSITETMLESASRMGASGKEQAAYSAMVVDYAKEDLELAKQLLASEVRGGKPLLERKLAVEQKTAALKDAQLAAATREAEVRMREVTAQKGTLEAQAGSASRMGASAKVQAGYAQEILKASEQDAALAREIYDQAKASHQEGAPLEEKRMAVAQKEAAANDARITAATKEQEVRMGVIGVEKSALETMRDYASRTGQSWRVQMRYQSEIISASREDLQLAKQAYDNARAAGVEGQALAEKRLAVVQKEASLGEAIMGKQRDFLEKAVSQAFGMGGGTKLQPNVNPRIFGPMIKDVTGQLQQGLMPRTIEETRAAFGAGIRGAIGTGGEKIAAATKRPGAKVRPADFVGPLAPGEELAAAGTEAPPITVKVVGEAEIMLRTDNKMFEAQQVRVALRESSPGATT